MTCAPAFTLFEVGANERAIAREIAHGGVDLRQRYTQLHISSVTGYPWRRTYITPGDFTSKLRGRKDIMESSMAEPRIAVSPSLISLQLKT